MCALIDLWSHHRYTWRHTLAIARARIEHSHGTAMTTPVMHGDRLRHRALARHCAQPLAPAPENKLLLSLPPLT